MYIKKFSPIKFSQIFPSLCLSKVEKYTTLVRRKSGCVSASKSKRESTLQKTNIS